jgi:antitoxin component YwqK of YwqJK toxin-antitoxin module
MSSELVVGQSVAQDLTEEYTRIGPGLYVLSKVTIRRPGLPNATISLHLGKRQEATPAPGSIRFSTGESITWTFDKRISGWRFTTSAGPQFATIVLDSSGRVVKSRFSSDGKTATTSPNLVDYEFKYTANGLMREHSTTVAGAIRTGYAFYDQFNMVRALNDEGYTTNVYRRRFPDGSTELKIVRPDRTVSLYLFSPRGDLTEQRSFAVSDASDKSKHYNVALFSYEALPSGDLRLSRVTSQRAGETFSVDYAYSADFPGAVTAVTQRREDQTIELKRSYAYSSQGLLESQVSTIYGRDGTTSEVVSGFEVRTRKGEPPYSPVEIVYLPSQQSSLFSNSGDQTTITSRDRNGTPTEEFTFSESSGKFLLTAGRNLTGTGPDITVERDARSEVRKVTSSYGETLEIAYDASGRVAKVTSVDRRGVTTVEQFDPPTKRSLSTTTTYPTGVREETRTSYTDFPSGIIQSATTTTTYVSGARDVTTVEFSPEGQLISITQNGVRREPYE